LPPDAEATKNKLIDAGLRLFAAKGIHGASLLEINKRAGQRNNSALHYHFGGRHGLLRAALQPRVLALREVRLQLLKEATSGAETDLRSLAAVYIEPFANLVEQGWRERAYLQISAALIADPGGSTDEILLLLGQAQGARVIEAIIERCPPMPRAIRAERLSLATTFVHRAAADRARMFETLRPGETVVLTHQQFVANLIDMFVAAISAPVTGEAEQAPSPARLGRKPGVSQPRQGAGRVRKSPTSPAEGG
jgi:AcrR family transcriptional regulator